MNLQAGKTEYTTEEHTTLIVKVRGMIDRLGIAQAELARQADVAGPTLSQYLNGNYPNETGRAATASKLLRWIASAERAAELRHQLPERPDFCPLSASTRIFQTLHYAHETGSMVLVAGPPGTSKTSTCLQYRASSVRVFYAAMDPTTKGVPAMMAEILTAMGQPDSRGTPQILRREIVQRALVGKCLIILDEAQHLLPPAIEAARAINDAARAMNGLAGVALVGNEAVYHRVGATGGARAFAQVSSRFAKRLWLEGASAKDAAAIAQAYAQKNGEPLDDKAAKFCVDIAQKPGGLRNIEKTMEAAIMAARGGEEPLSIADLQGAFASLSGLTVGR